MHHPRYIILLLAQNNPIYKFTVTWFIVLLVLVLIFLLARKLRSLRAEPDEQDPTAIDIAAILLQSTPKPAEPEPLEITMQPDVPFVVPADTTVVIPTPPPAPLPVVEDQPKLSLPADDNGHTAISSILNSLTDLIFEFDENKVCINVWYNKTQASPVVDLDSFKGKTIAENIGEEKGAGIINALDFVIRNRTSTIIEFLSFFGSGRWFSARISPVFDGAGRYTGRITASVSDISEHKKYEAALKEQQEQLLEAQKIARIGNWWYDVKQKQTHWSDNLLALLGISRLPPGTSHFEYYSRLTHPEDRRLVYQFFSNMSSNPMREAEHRIVTQKGQHKYFRILRGEPIRDESGVIIRISGIIKDVTESRVAERTIKKSRAELLEAQTIAKIGNWKWYFDRKMLSWSDEVYHIHEVPVTHQVQRGLSHFKILLKYVHPEDRDILLGFLKDPANLKRSSYEYRIITPNGNIKYLGIIIGKVKRNEDGNVHNVIGTLQDITERKTAELIIQRTEDNYKLVLESIKLAAISLDSRGNIVFCNKYLARLLGYSQSSLIGLNWHQNFIPENLKSVFKEWYDKNEIKLQYINPVICHNGEQRIISWQNTTVYDEYGRIKQTTSIGEDITDQQKDRQKLITAKEAAEKSSLFKSEFLSTMSHEIRTPMNAVIGTTNLLLSENPRPDQLPYLTNLKFSGESLLSIIDDILDYNKIEAGKLQINKLPMNLHQLTGNVRQSFYARAIEKNLQLTTDIDAAIPQTIKGDSVRLGQILNNLVSNAIKFTLNGRVNIQVKEKSRTTDRIVIYFAVSDSGIGIAPALIDKIFEPFVQETQSQDFGGSGLGLAIVKHLVELHGAQINLTSAPGQGTRFSFEIAFEYLPDPVKPKVASTPNNAPPPAASVVLPAAFMPAAMPAQPKAAVLAANSNMTSVPAELAALQNADLSGMKVLVVDDNKMNILIANRFLNKWNIKTHEAGNGVIAIEMVQKNNYDLVIMDLQMPVMDGFEATREIKKAYPQLPVIALTADAMPETYNKARNSGMDDYLTKPFMPEILFEKVSKYYKN